MGLSPVMVELRATTSEFTSRMAEARHEVEKLSKEGEPHFQKLQQVGKAALVGVAGAAIALGTLSVKAALDGEAAHARLAQAVKNSGGSMEELEPKVAALSGKMANLGFSNDQVETALGQMTTSLRDPEKAMGAMGLAADLARYKHIGLSEASLTVAKAMEGQLRPLKQLGIDLPAAAGGALKLQHAHEGLEKAQAKVNEIIAASPDAANAASKAHKQYEHAIDGVHTAQAKLVSVQGAAEAITKGLAAAVGGQATVAAQTFQGKAEVLTAKLENLAEKIGTALLPILGKLIGVVTSTVAWFQKHKTAAEVLGVAVGTVLVAAITSYVGALAVAQAKSIASFAKMAVAGAAWAAEALLKMYIVGAQFTIMAGKAAASAAVQVASWVRSAAASVASAAVQVASWVAVAAAATAAFIAENVASLGIIAAIGLVVAAAIYLYKHWDQVWGGIKDAASSAASFIKQHLVQIVAAIFPIGVAAYELYNHWSQIWGNIKKVVSDAFHAITSAVSGFASSVGSLLMNAGKSLIDGFINGIKGAIGGVKNTLGDLTNSLTSWKGPPSRDKVLLHGSGQMVMQGFQNGLESRYGHIQNSLGKFTSGLHVSDPHAGRGGSGHSSHPARHPAAPSRDVYGTYANADAKYRAEVERHNKAVAKSHEAAALRIKHAHERALAAAARAHKRHAAEMLHEAKTLALQIIAHVKDRATAALGTAKDAANAAHDAVIEATKSLDELLKKRDDYASSVSSGISGGFGNVVDIAKNADPAAGVAGIAAALQEQLAKTKDFGRQLKDLTAKGASKDLVEQLAKAGVDAGSALAASLNASGSGAVAQISGLMKDIGDAAKTASDAIAASYYQSGIDQVTAHIQGMQSQEAALNAQVDRIEAILARLGKAKKAVNAATTVAAVRTATVGVRQSTAPASALTHPPVVHHHTTINVAGSMDHATLAEVKQALDNHDRKLVTMLQSGRR